MVAFKPIALGIIWGPVYHIVWVHGKIIKKHKPIVRRLKVPRKDPTPPQNKQKYLGIHKARMVENQLEGV